MIWGYPYFWKHPYINNISIGSVNQSRFSHQLCQGVWSSVARRLELMGGVPWCLGWISFPANGETAIAGSDIKIHPLLIDHGSEPKKVATAWCRWSTIWAMRIWRRTHSFRHLSWSEKTPRWFAALKWIYGRGNPVQCTFMYFQLFSYIFMCWSLALWSEDRTSCGK